MQPVANRRRWSGRVSLVVGVFLALLAAGPAGTLAGGEFSGLVAGPFIVQPFVETNLEADSNVLNAPSSVPITGDTAASAGFGLDLRMPFGNNRLEFSYSGAQVEYNESNFAGGLKQEGNLGLRLEFRSGDQVRIRDRFRRDFAQVVDSSIPGDTAGESPETKYFGSPYRYNRLDVDFERNVPARRGYRVRLGHRDFRYEQETIGTQFEFAGMDNMFQYSQPLTAGRKLVVQYSMTRLDNSRDSEGVFRKEVSDSLEAGLSGVGSVRPFFFRVGYSRFFYKYPDGSAGTDDGGSIYRGLSGFARWSLPVGGRSGLSLSVSRRPLPSSFDTFYVSNQFRGIAERGFRPRVKVALLVGVRQNRYADEIPQLGCDGLRDDLTWDAGFRASWSPHNLIELGLVGRHEQRESNCRNLDYVSSSLRLGMRFGWF